MRVLKTIKPFFQKREALNVLLIAMPLFLVLLITLVPDTAHASIPGVSHVSKWILDRVSELLFRAAQSFVNLGITLVGSAVKATYKLIENPVVTSQWASVRGTSLSLFGLAVLAIAFMNLMRLKIDEWGINRTLPKLLFAAFLVIFSKFILGSIINLGNMLSVALAGPGFADFDAKVLAIANGLNTNDYPSIGVSFGIFIVCFIAFFLLLILAAALFVRAFLISLLIVLSPLAFALTALPITQKYFSKFWDEFIKLVLFLPLCLFLLSIGFSFMAAGDMGTPFKEALTDSSDPAKGKDAIDALDGFLLALVTIPLAILLPLKLLGPAGATLRGAASRMGGMATGKYGIPGAPVDMKAIRGWAGERGKKIGQRKQEKVGNYMRKGFGNIPYVGEKITGETSADRAKFNNELSKKFDDPLGLSKTERRQYAQGTLNRSALSGEKQKWLKDFESRGGSQERAVDHLVANGQLDHATATNGNVANYIRRTGDYEEAVKKSDLHHLRAGGTFAMHNLSGAQLAKMDPADIRRFSPAQAAGATTDFAKTVHKNSAMTVTQKRAVADTLTAAGNHIAAAEINSNI